MRKKTQTLHSEFQKYIEYICNHINYATLPDKMDGNGNITWVIPSPLRRNAWWDRKVVDLGVEDRAAVARIIHPKELNGIKPCSICGTQLSVHYVYPNSYLLNKLNIICNSHKFQPYKLDISTILKVIFSCKEGHDEIVMKLLGVKKTDDSIKINDILKNRLSPGVMSNAGDRLDGFHTYNACCRKNNDKGREDFNMNTYLRDRRAYEYWVDGNTELASALMAEYKNLKKKTLCSRCGKVKKVGGDHIGPISLGFSLDNNLAPTCKTCNSAKNNRFTLNDLEDILKRSNTGENVVNWYMKYVWDKVLKYDIKDTAIIRHKMLANMHIFFDFFYELKKANQINLIKQYINTNNAGDKYEFINFEPLGTQIPLKTKRGETYTKSKIIRTIRVSLETLDEYHAKSNRKTRYKNLEEIHILSDRYIELVKNSKSDDAKKSYVMEYFKLISDILFEEYR